jgi:hypothetical protein
MLGHSSTQIVPRYALGVDENRLDARKKLEELKKAAISSKEVAEPRCDEAPQLMRQIEFSSVTLLVRAAFTRRYTPGRHSEAASAAERVTALPRLNLLPEGS